MITICKDCKHCKTDSIYYRNAARISPLAIAMRPRQDFWVCEAATIDFVTGESNTLCKDKNKQGVCPDFSEKTPEAVAPLWKRLF